MVFDKALKPLADPTLGLGNNRLGMQFRDRNILQLINNRVNVIFATLDPPFWILAFASDTLCRCEFHISMAMLFFNVQKLAISQSEAYYLDFQRY